MSYKKDMSKYEHLEGWERCGFGEQLDKWAEKYGERTAVTDSEDEISYMELKQKADCLAAAFLRKGILKGDKVLVQLPNWKELLNWQSRPLILWWRNIWDFHMCRWQMR